MVPRPAYNQTSVYTQLDFTDHRRHKEQINFCPILHPIRFSDTAFVYINSTRKRFVSRTFYEPRVRPRSFSETTYNNPKSIDQLYVSYFDSYVHENRKWFKTCIEIKAKMFTSAQLLRSQNNNYIHTSMTSTTSSLSDSLSSGDRLNENGSSNGLHSGRSFQEVHDPGASQVFIPKRRERAFGHDSLINGEIILNFPNSKVDLNFQNGYDDDDFSDV